MQIFQCTLKFIPQSGNTHFFQVYSLSLNLAERSLFSFFFFANTELVLQRLLYYSIGDIKLLCFLKYSLYASVLNNGYKPL